MLSLFTVKGDFENDVTQHKYVIMELYFWNDIYNLIQYIYCSDLFSYRNRK